SEHNFSDAARPLSRAALDALLRVEREPHEPMSIALKLRAANCVSCLGATTRISDDGPRRSRVRLGSRLDWRRHRSARVGRACDAEHRLLLHAAANDGVLALG